MIYIASGNENLLSIAQAYTIGGQAYAGPIAIGMGWTDPNSDDYSSTDPTVPDSLLFVTGNVLGAGTQVNIPNNYLNAAGIAYAQQSGQSVSGAPGAAGTAAGTGSNSVLYIGLAILAYALIGGKHK